MAGRSGGEEPGGGEGLEKEVTNVGTVLGSRGYH